MIDVGYPRMTMRTRRLAKDEVKSLNGQPTKEPCSARHKQHTFTEFSMSHADPTGKKYGGESSPGKHYEVHDCNHLPSTPSRNSYPKPRSAKVGTVEQNCGKGHTNSFRDIYSGRLVDQAFR